MLFRSPLAGHFPYLSQNPLQTQFGPYSQIALYFSSQSLWIPLYPKSPHARIHSMRSGFQAGLPGTNRSRHPKITLSSPCQGNFLKAVKRHCRRRSPGRCALFRIPPAVLFLFHPPGQPLCIASVSAGSAIPRFKAVLPPWQSPVRSYSGRSPQVPLFCCHQCPFCQ